MSLAEFPFDLVEVKLAAPPTRPGAVPRTTVVERLCTGSTRFTTVIAPAGYGKTTLLAQWSEADRRPFAWVGVDHHDDDVVVLMRHIAAAVHRVANLQPEALNALAGGRPTTWTKGVVHLGNALVGLERPLVLVLDDLHAVSNVACLDMLAELSRYVPAGSQIAMASREEIALPVARWRGQGLVQEVGVADLSLDDGEAGLLFEAAGVEVDAEQTTALTVQTEGWPAGLYLAALSIRAGGAGMAGAPHLDANDRFVSDYFRHELMSRLPAAETRFLTHTSVLARMCGGLCDAVLETTGSAGTLEALARANGFVVPLDRQGVWYRYHHLFRQLLRDELEQSEPDLVQALNTRAMHWCYANDLPERAIVYAQAAGDTAAVAGLIEEIASAVWEDGRRETVEEWLGWFDDDELARYPAVAVYSAWADVLGGGAGKAAHLLALAETSTSAGPLTDGSATIEPWVALLRAAMMRDGVEQALADADRALQLLPADSRWRPLALGVRGAAYTLLGTLDRAADDFAASVELGIDLGATSDVLLAQTQLARLAMRQGEWTEAKQWVLDAQAVLEAAGGLGDYPAVALVRIAAAHVALRDGRQNEARTLLAQTHRLRPLLDHGIPWVTVEVGLDLARAHLALAEIGAARSVFAETDQVLKLRPNLGSLVDDARDMRDRLAAAAGPLGGWAMSLTAAELRLLPYLATHLTIPEIATRLFLSRNTVKTEAVSVYRKLSASSRSEAIARAIEVGLLENSIYPPGADINS